MLQSYADDEEKEGWSFKTYDFAFFPWTIPRLHTEQLDFDEFGNVKKP